MSTDVSASAPARQAPLAAELASTHGFEPPIDLASLGRQRTTPQADLDGHGQASARKGGRFRDWRRRYTAAAVVGDAVSGIAAVLLTSQLFPSAGHFAPDKLLVLALGAGLAWPAAVALCRGYDQRKTGVGDDEFRAVLRGAILAIAAGAVPSAIVDKFGLVSLSAGAIPIAALLSALVRLAGRYQLHRAQLHGRSVRRVVLVGGTRSVADLTDLLTRDQLGMAVLGVCVPEVDRDEAESRGLRVLGTTDEVASVVKRCGADSVAMAGSEGTGHLYLKQLAWSLEGVDVELLVNPGLVEVAGPRMHIRPHVGLPLLHVEQPHFSGWRRFVKRAADIVLTSVLLLVFSPLLIAVAIAIKLDGGGPVLFRQVRVGLDGSLFTMYKFRSMHVDAEERLAELRERNPLMGVMFKMENDPRITTVGRTLRRFSLDELPQLFNVVSGSMSLVGPRPPLPAEVDVYEKHARRRLLVTPGITGLWQVSGRSLLSWEETVRLDLRYVENWTFTLDLLILWKTFAAVLMRRGAF